MSEEILYMGFRKVNVFEHVFGERIEEKIDKLGEVAGESVVEFGGVEKVEQTVEERGGRFESDALDFFESEGILEVAGFARFEGEFFHGILEFFVVILDVNLNVLLDLIKNFLSVLDFIEIDAGLESSSLLLESLLYGVLVEGVGEDLVRAVIEFDALDRGVELVREMG